MRARVMGMAMFVVATMAACSGGGSTTAADASSSSATTTTQPPATTAAAPTTTEDPKAAVEAAYLAYWAMLDRVAAVPDASDSELAQRIAEPALSDIVEQLRIRNANGQHTEVRAPELDRHEVRAVAIEGGAAIVTDCFVDGRVVVDAAGQVVDDKVVTKALRATFESSSGSWKVATIETVDQQDGVGSCGA
jgi:hypothetical protein